MNSPISVVLTSFSVYCTLCKEAFAESFLSACQVETEHEVTGAGCRTLWKLRHNFENRAGLADTVGQYIQLGVWAHRSKVHGRSLHTVKVTLHCPAFAEWEPIADDLAIHS